MTNPFELARNEIERELWRRETVSSYANFVKNTTPGYTLSKFHTYLCNQIDEFLDKKETPSFDVLLLSVPPQHGKLASNDTPVLTTSGFKNHGDLVVGDYVYGLDGEPKRVTHIFPKQLADKIIRFSNGEEIKVHGNHEWVLHDRKKHGAPIVQIETKNIETSDDYDKHRYLLPEIVDPLEKKAKKRKISVVSIEDIEPVEGNCIEVEGGIYLIGKTMIPTHNSITVTKRVAAYQMMRKANTRVIIGSYNEDFAIEFGRANREIIEEFGEELFGIKLRKQPNRNVEFETSNGGRCISRGMMSGIAGNPANLIIIDDPIKNRQEADSKTTRASLINEYLSSVRTRIAPGGKLIVIQTRWHEDDLYGWIQANEGNVISINMPCEWDEDIPDVLGRVKGDALVPEIGRGNLWLEDFKRAYTGTNGTRAWTALYQGKPTMMEGNIIKREWWQYYTELPEDIPYTIISADCAFKANESSDFVAIQVWGKKNDKFYLLDAIKQRLSFVETVDALRSMRKQYPNTDFVFIEDKANGTAVIDVLSREMEGVIPIEPEGGKESRVHAVTPAIERGDVLLPRYSGFVGDFIDECSAFPNSDNDDQVDAMSQALFRMIFVDAEVIVPSNIRYRPWTEDMMEDYEAANEKLQIELLTLWGYPEEWA